MNWHARLRYDPLPALLSTEFPAVETFARRDLLEEVDPPIEEVWILPEVQRILKKQRSKGAWERSGENKHPAVRVDLIETWRNLRFLVEQYGMTRAHPRIEAACEFVFTCQTEAGDLRGFLANQYATYYTGALMALLIQAGYADDERIRRGFGWLLAMRQNDGGWTVPMITHKFDRATQYRLASEMLPPVEPDRSKPFSHNWTGMVLRGFAAHPEFRVNAAGIHAANLLKSRFFRADVYTSYQSADYWVRFEFPFWWNNLVSALDSLSRMGFSADDEQIRQALNWLTEHQKEDGLWKLDYRPGREKQKETRKTHEMMCWVSLAICRILKRLSP